jgi:archaellum component FlaG (FlaF/FlaG flagellin family)
MAGTFGATSHAADQNIRTDFTITLATYSSTTGSVTVYLKNTGTAIVLAHDLLNSDVFVSDTEGNMGSTRLPFVASVCPASGSTCPTLSSSNSPSWAPGETLEIATAITPLTDPNDNINFEFILPNGITRSLTFSQAGPGVQ